MTTQEDVECKHVAQRLAHRTPIGLPVEAVLDVTLAIAPRPERRIALIQNEAAVEPLRELLDELAGRLTTPDR